MKINRYQIRRLIESTIMEQEGSGKLDKKTLIALASSLYSAMHGGILGLGTDEEKIKKVFEKLDNNKTDLELLKKEYQRLYKRDLVKDLHGDMIRDDIIEYIEKVFPGAMIDDEGKFR